MWEAKLVYAIYRTGVTWRDQNLGCKVQVIYMDINMVILCLFSAKHIPSQKIISPLLIFSTNQIPSYITAYRSAGFLASLSADQSRGDLKYDRIHHNNGSFYDPLTGVYTTPFTGYYLFTGQVVNVTKILIKVH